MTQPTGENVTFTMKLDASDLRRLLASNGPGGGPPLPPPDPDKEGKKNQSLFKPLAVLYGVEKILGGILKNSTIANTYMGAMGKMFGAAIDILLIPFIPLFNLIMVGISKLIMWLVSSGYLEKMTKIMEEVAKNIVSMVKWIAEMAKAIKDLNFGKIAGLLKDAVVGVVKESVQNPTVALATVATLAGGYVMARSLPLLGKAIKGGEGMIFGRGGGQVAKKVPTIIGAPGTGGSAGLGSRLMGRAGPALLAGAGVNIVSNAALTQMGVGQKKASVVSGALSGAATGAILGSAAGPWGTAIGGVAGGLIGGGLAWMSNKKSQAGAPGGGAGGMSMVNSNNVINFTQNNTFMGGGDVSAATSQAVEAIEKKTGYVLAGRAVPQQARAIGASGSGAGLRFIGSGVSAAGGLAGVGAKKLWGAVT